MALALGEAGGVGLQGAGRCNLVTGPAPGNRRAEGPGSPVRPVRNLGTFFQGADETACKKEEQKHREERSRGEMETKPRQRLSLWSRRPPWLPTRSYDKGQGRRGRSARVPEIARSEDRTASP